MLSNEMKCEKLCTRENYFCDPSKKTTKALTQLAYKTMMKEGSTSRNAACLPLVSMTAKFNGTTKSNKNYNTARLILKKLTNEKPLQNSDDELFRIVHALRTITDIVSKELQSDLSDKNNKCHGEGIIEDQLINRKTFVRMIIWIKIMTSTMSYIHGHKDATRAGNLQDAIRLSTEIMCCVLMFNSPRGSGLIKTMTWLSKYAEKSDKIFRLLMFTACIRCHEKIDAVFNGKFDMISLDELTTGSQI